MRMKSFAPPFSTIQRNKFIHVLADDLFHTVLEKEILIGANAVIAKTKRKKSSKAIVFVDRWMQCSLLQLISQCARD